MSTNPLNWLKKTVHYRCNNGLFSDLRTLFIYPHLCERLLQVLFEKYYSPRRIWRVFFHAKADSSECAAHINVEDCLKLCAC